MGLVMDSILAPADVVRGGKPQAKGDYLLATPGNQYTLLNATTTVGGCTGIYYSLVFQMPKWGYTIKKLDEWMDVSPLHTEAYTLTIEKRGQIEGTIKQSLAQIAGLVADYELAKHDLRKYEEILEFWKKGKKDDHVLRSLFIDRVDVHTGEGLSIISMARRWPTIISDFIRMSKMEGDKGDVNKIRDHLNTTVAEANVLKTKNDLYEQWKKSFFPEVKERYARIKNLVQVRRISIDQYREWLKPYMSRHKMMSDKSERNPKGNVSSVYIAPGFGTAFAASGMRFIAWKAFTLQEATKPQRMSTISPIDHVVKGHVKKIEEKYGIKYTDDNVKEILDGAYKSNEMKKEHLYYNMFDITVSKSLIKIPKGGELEDIDFHIKHWIVSQNLLLTFLIEINAKEAVFERQINEMIGVKEVEEGFLKEVEKRFGDEEPEEKKQGGIKAGFKKIKSGFWKVRGYLRGFSKYFFRAGPYESSFLERVTKWYMIPMGAKNFGPLISFIKWKMGVIGSTPKY